MAGCSSCRQPHFEVLLFYLTPNRRSELWLCRDVRHPEWGTQDAACVHTTPYISLNVSPSFSHLCFLECFLLHSPISVSSFIPPSLFPSSFSHLCFLLHSPISVSSFIPPSLFPSSFPHLCFLLHSPISISLNVSPSFPHLCFLLHSPISVSSSVLSV